jgi:nucleotide-binding universal stress UspA family protein
VVGEAFGEILRASEGADLVVLGQRGRNPLKGLVTGGTADRLLRSCGRSMLIVKQANDRLYRRILVPVDFTVHTEACLQAAAALASEADIHAFHALDSSEAFEMRMAGVPAAVIRDQGDIASREVHLRMRCIAAKAGVDPDRLDTVVRHGPAAACTLDQEGVLGTDLIVVGKRGASAMADFFLGSVTRRLLAESKSDLLVIPRTAAQALRSRPPAQAQLVWR